MSPKQFSRVSTTLFLTAAMVTSAALADEVRPVRIATHEQPDLDACLSMARVVEAGGTGLAVRAAPDGAAAVTDEIAVGAVVFLCDTSEDEVWSGVVYPQTEDQDCGLGSGVETPKPYDGPCKSGWVLADRVPVEAG
ncbi:MAG: integron [Ahniella sp.]|nr:integron [Ahniella sp.]